MYKTKIAIIHFQPLEKYPPIMNLINIILENNKIFCFVYTTKRKNQNWFKPNNIVVNRISSQNEIFRYWNYFKFNIVVLIGLIIEQPKVVIAYETYSIFPIYFYKLLFGNTITFVHHHEYISPKEIVNCSRYFKFLHYLEKRLNLICNYISHTNDERRKLFLFDNPQISIINTFTNPNFPPYDWYLTNNNRKTTNYLSCKIIKLVHIGALSLDTMHTKKMLEWVILQKGKYTIDFYTDNITEDAKKLIISLNDSNIRLYGPINYFNLPKVLADYHIGLTLYNGHIPNFVYNVPNKVFEYLACGLDVWYSKDLISTQKLNNSESVIYDFEKIPDFLLRLNFDSAFFGENSIYKKILEFVD